MESYFKSITNVVTNYLYLALLKRLDVETLRQILAVAVATAKAKADETETKIDDWIVEALENFVASDEKLQVIVDWIRGKIAGNICSDTVEGKNEYEQIASAALAASEKPEGALEVVKLISSVLQVVVPIVIEWWKNQNHPE